MPRPNPRILPSTTTLAACAVLMLSAVAAAGDDPVAKFRQLGTELPTPNVYRNAAGAPGPQYWQQRADYRIEVTLDEAAKRITGSETITYSNLSPDPLRYLWVQLDQNRFRDDSLARRSETAESRRDESDEADSLTYSTLRRHQEFQDVEHGCEITSVRGRGGEVDYTISGTMMRVDLPRPLRPGEQTELSIDWAHNIIDEKMVGGRGGYEHFPDSDTYLFFLAQWFPRMAAYTDYKGWQHHQFLGSGEFTLEFGDYDVEITVPADHVVSSTGVLRNPERVLSAEQRRRLSRASSAETPVFIVTPEEALANEKSRDGGTRTWHFTAENVRDFAWASSRKFIWDAMVQRQDDAEHPEVMVMSFYPNEAEPIWSHYSSHAVAHTLEVYSRFSFPYPYPTAQSVNTWERGGMEYPMITFNGYRPTREEKEGSAEEQVTYSRRTKYGLIGVIIHEIGHIYFPMTVNSDEREWTWMDEGFNTFLQYLAELEWEEKFPSWGGKSNVLDHITEYMKSEYQVPIMTQSDSILQFGPNAYSKPTAAFIVLRETVMGRELFDHAFREYARRWKFKRPTPADFFRTMEDASAVDLDWYWRGWFYSTDHVDVSIADVREYKVSSNNPDVEFPLERQRLAEEVPEPVTVTRNREEGRATRLERIAELADFYNENDPYTVSNEDRNEYQEDLEELEDWERATLARAITDDELVYFVDFENQGGLLTPLPLRLTYVDGGTEELMIPAEIWRRNGEKVTKLLIRRKKITEIALDTLHQTPDTDRSDNHFPRRITPSRLELYKAEDETRDLMADMLVELRGGEKGGTHGEKDVPLARTEPEE